MKLKLALLVLVLLTTLAGCGRYGRPIRAEQYRETTTQRVSDAELIERQEERERRREAEREAAEAAEPDESAPADDPAP